MKKAEHFRVDFIGIGAVKSGTSWLAGMLAQHPGVCFSREKEVNYFNAQFLGERDNTAFEKGLDYYRKFWPASIPGNARVGEFSPQYFYDKAAAERIREVFPDVKLVLVLRNPVERAFSHYHYRKTFTRGIPDNLPFGKALEKFPYLLEMGNYSFQLENYLRIFPGSSFHILIFEELVRAPEEKIKSLFRYLGLDPDFKPGLEKENVSKAVKNEQLHELFQYPGKLKQVAEKSVVGRKLVDRFVRSRLYISLSAWKNKLISRNTTRVDKPEMKQEVKEKLQEYYRPDIDKLEKILGKDLNSWKK